MRVLEQFKQERRMKLDMKDKKILSLLSKNARTPHTIIAKSVGLSRDSISYRIKNLVKNQIVQGYRTVINANKLGYEAYHLFVQLSPPGKEAEKMLVEKFKSYPFTRTVLRFSGKYDYEFAIIAKNIREFDKNLRTILEDCTEYLQDYEVLIITDYYTENFFPRSFLIAKDTELARNKEINEITKVDKKDLDILQIIADNALIQLYAIANKVNISADAVNYRIKKLMATGIIKKFIPVINYSALGYSNYAFMLNIKGLTDKKEAKLKQILSTDKNILWAVKTIGRYNVLMYVCVPNTEELHKTMMNLRAHFPGELNNYETLIAYEEYKFTYFPECIRLE
jgi:Lrp/AsnC family transcriptional regulator for asnA, asnC and gidA